METQQDHGMGLACWGSFVTPFLRATVGVAAATFLPEAKKDQKSLHLRLARLAEVPLAMKQDKAFNPFHISYLGPTRIAKPPDPIPDRVEKLGGLGCSDLARF